MRAVAFFGTTLQLCHCSSKAVTEDTETGGYGYTLKFRMLNLNFISFSLLLIFFSHLKCENIRSSWAGFGKLATVWQPLAYSVPGAVCTSRPAFTLSEFT